eukprot:TRINITY_DN3052_c0_g1_i8.p1 TRINITY_DN3052_c0_g1~~TRINITY_DN3052_c0_g1_i8.p1  ORF type:complete len:1045 (+),score=208.08 TRINITY_DN3052_c0_g1_i8:58-3192(+)
MGQQTSVIEVLQTNQLSEEEVLELLKKGKEKFLQEKDQEEKTSLHWAAAAGLTKVVSGLLEAGLAINCEDQHKQTPLHSAVFTNKHETVRFLVSKGADLEHQDENGMTPLHWAVYNNCYECVDLLQQLGASLSIKNKKGQNAIDIAKAQKRRYRTKLLKFLHPPEDIAPPDPISQESRLVSLCNLWGVIKYVHPYLAYKDIDWDQALINAIPNLCLENLSPSDFRETISTMLSVLKDPNTRVIDVTPPIRPKEIPKDLKSSTDLSEKSNTQIEQSGAQSQKNTVNHPQPFVIPLPGNIAAIVVTDYDQFTGLDKQEMLDNAFTSAASSAGGLVFDVRCGNPSFKASCGAFLAYIFCECFKRFLKSELYLPTYRQRFWHGFPEHSGRGSSHALRHGFIVQDGESLDFRSESKSPDRPMVFLVNKYTPQSIINIALGLKALDKAKIVYQAVDESDFCADPSGGSKPLIYEPGIEAIVHTLPYNFKVYIRTNEIVNSDGTLGFNPDAIIEQSQRVPIPSRTDDPTIQQDPAIRAAVTLCVPASALSPSANTSRSRSRDSPSPLYSKRTTDKEYPDMIFPTLPYRYLALFRLWNSVHYFYPYKDHVQSNWNEQMLRKFLSKFESASNKLEYALVIMEMLNTLQDTHSFVHSLELSNFIGTRVPPVRIKTIGGQAVVTHVQKQIQRSKSSSRKKFLSQVIHKNKDQDSQEKEVPQPEDKQQDQRLDGDKTQDQDNTLEIDQQSLNVPKKKPRLRPGDILVEIDGEPIESVRLRLSRLFSGSTPESTNWRLDLYLLAGQSGSVAKLKAKRDEEEIEVSYSRIYEPGAQLEWEPKNRGEIWKTLDQEKNVGYIDLTRLNSQDLDTAFLSVKNTKSLVLDLRGNIKVSVYRLAPYLVKRKSRVAFTLTPLLVPSPFLFENLESSTILTQQISQVKTDQREHVYEGKLVVLISTSTVSKGEHCCLYLKACRPDLKIFGQRSNGSSGNTTNIALPGDIVVGFTGLGISHPDGDPVRKGITPDITVEDTVHTIVSGNDTIVEASIAYLKDVVHEE